MNFKSFIFRLIYFVSLNAGSEKKPTEILYIHPLPDSRYNTVQTSVLLKLKESFVSQLNNSSVKIEVIGYKIGFHTGKNLVYRNTITFSSKEYTVD